MEWVAEGSSPSPSTIRWDSSRVEHQNILVYYLTRHIGHVAQQ